MTLEAFVRAVEAEHARQRELALLVDRVLVEAPQRDARVRSRVLSRFTGLARVLDTHRRRPRHLAAADAADRMFAG